MWASEGGASVWESRESSEWGEIDESYSALGTVDPDDPEVRRRVRSAYSNWCREYNKETDESRFPRFKTNYLKMEQMAWEQGSEITLNEFADCSPEEYRNAVGLGSSHEEERLERLRREQEAKERLMREQERLEALRKKEREAAASAVTPFRRKVVQMMMFFSDTYRKVFSFQHPPVHDPCTVAYVIAPHIFKVTTIQHLEPQARCADRQRCPGL